MKRIGSVRGVGVRLAVFGLPDAHRRWVVGRTIFIILVILVPVFGFAPRTWTPNGGGNVASIHLRILAHSDSEADRRVKELVRPEVERALNGWLQGQRPADADDVRRLLLPRLSDLKRRVDDVLRQAGAPYAARVEWGVFPMPAKSDGVSRYPAGRYEMLRIMLGDGRGDNFWCVLFPSLCFPRSEDCRSGKDKAAGAADRPDSGSPKVGLLVLEWGKKAFHRVREPRDERSGGLFGKWSGTAAKAARFFRSRYN